METDERPSTKSDSILTFVSSLSSDDFLRFVFQYPGFVQDSYPTSDSASCSVQSLHTYLR